MLSEDEMRFMLNSLTYRKLEWRIVKQATAEKAQTDDRFDLNKKRPANKSLSVTVYSIYCLAFGRPAKVTTFIPGIVFFFFLMSYGYDGLALP